MKRTASYELNALSREHGGRLLKSVVEVDIFRLVSQEPPTISKYLEENDVELAPPGTILHFLLVTYQNAGWRKVNNTVPVENKSAVVLEPLLELPSIEFHLFYTVLGISTEKMETFFQEVQQDFHLSLILAELCRDFGTDINKCFPSLRNEVSNREKQIERSEARLRLTSPSSLREKNDRGERQRANKEKRRKKNEHMERKFPRIIPVCSLPLVLSRLPDFYQEVNITLAQCELLERTIWSSVELRNRFDDHVKTQLNQMKHNRRFLNFQNQVIRQSKFDKAVDRYEFLLKEAELLFVQLCEREYREKERELDRKIERRVKKLKISSDGKK